jgi:hypothetical protein
MGLLLLLATAGLIAYLGDVIGRRIGRKRLTIFGLRPKNTAILFTVVTGVLIALFTVGLTLLASADLRNRILHYNQIVAKLKGDADQERSNADTARQEWQDTARALADSKQQFVAEQKQLTTAEGSLAVAEGNLAAAQKRLADAETAARAAESRAAEKARAAQAAQARVAELVKRGNALETDVRAAEAKAAAAIAEAQTAAAEAKAADAARRQARADLTEAQKETIQVRLNQLEDPILYKTGDEVERLYLPDFLTADDVLAQLRLFNERICKLPRTSQAGLYFDLRAFPTRILPGNNYMAPDDYMRELAAQIGAHAGRPGREIYLRAVALLNCLQYKPLVFSGTPLVYTFQVFNARRVFHAGDVLGRAHVDGSGSLSNLVDALRRLVAEKVRPAMVEGGMMPAPPDHPDEIGPEFWLPALLQIQAAGRMVTVEVRATRNIGVADRLADLEHPAIEFRVSPDVP